MLEISKAQLAAMGAAQVAVFERRLAEELRAEGGERIASLNDEELKEFIRLGLALGDILGFSWQSALAGVVTLMMDVGPAFYDHPAVTEALEAASDSFPDDEDARLEAMIKNIAPGDWQAATDTGWSGILSPPQHG